MKNIFSGLVLIFIIFNVLSCRKTSFITSKDAQLQTSVDTLHFDTIFTSTGSVTHSFKIFNNNNQKLRLNNVKLMGGSSSFFKLNVDGTPGTSFTDIEVEANDSLYVFASVTINPNAANIPFIVQDSILISYNGNDRFVQLDAFGQNANFYRGRRITKDTSWNNDLPFVLLGGLSVDPGAILTINKGCKIYAHADAPIIVNGTLKVLGEQYDSTKVIFRGDRLDPEYRDFPGSWPGIYFSETSRDNILTYAVIQNAYQGVITQQLASNNRTKITLNECVIDNIYDAGILSLNSSITARNCLITNCGNNIAIGSGGTYNFNHCTVSTYGNIFFQHKNPVLVMSNSNEQGQVFSLNASFRNCIFYGDSAFVKNEIVIDVKSGTPNISFQNILYRGNSADPSTATFANSIKNQDPQFDSVDVSKRFYNFRLKDVSPAIDNGISTTLQFDLDAKARGSQPDIGAYEF